MDPSEYRYMKILILLLGIFLASNAEAATGTFWVNSASSGQHCVSSSTDPGSGSSSQTITQGLACVGAAETDAGAGSTVIIKSGTYAEQLWRLIPNGVAGNPFTLKSESAHGAILKPTSVPSGNSIIELDNTVHYVVLDGLVLDGTSGGAGLNGLGFSASTQSNLNNITINNLEIRSVTGNGMALYGTNYTITNNNIHDGGTDGFDHACYCTPSNSYVHGNSFVNWTGYGWHANTGGADTINNNELSANIFSGNAFVGGQWGVLLAGRNQRFFNNILYGNNAAIIVGHFANTTDTNFIYENTIYNNPNGTYGAIVLQGQSNTFIQNNIIRASGNAWDTNFETPTGFSNNICSNTTAGCNNTDPLFVNAGSNDFHLQSGSPAINAGLTLGAPYNVDYAGTARPQGAGYDMGAYEFIPPSSGAPTGMVAFNGGPGVAINSCGSGASVTGNDSTGIVTIGGGAVTSCSVNFSGTYGAAPNCIISLGATGATFGVTSTTSGFTVATSADVHGGSLTYMCVQKGKQ